MTADDICAAKDVTPQAMKWAGSSPVSAALPLTVQPDPPTHVQREAAQLRHAAVQGEEGGRRGCHQVHPSPVHQSLGQCCALSLLALVRLVSSASFLSKLKQKQVRLSLGDCCKDTYDWLQIWKRYFSWLCNKEEDWGWKENEVRRGFYLYSYVL